MIVIAKLEGPHPAPGAGFRRELLLPKKREVVLTALFQGSGEIDQAGVLRA